MCNAFTDLTKDSLEVQELKKKIKRWKKALIRIKKYRGMTYAWETAIIAEKALKEK